MATVTFMFIAPEMDQEDPMFEAYIGSKMTGYSIQDCRSYGGNYMVSQCNILKELKDYTEEDFRKFRMTLRGEYRTLSKAKEFIMECIELGV